MMFLIVFLLKYTHYCIQVSFLSGCQKFQRPYSVSPKVPFSFFISSTKSGLQNMSMVD